MFVPRMQSVCSNEYAVSVDLPSPPWRNRLTLPTSPQVHNKDVIVLEPHSHHTLLASFGEDTAETDEDIDNTHAHVVWSVGTLFAVT